jgi:hypothetical protein
MSQTSPAFLGGWVSHVSMNRLSISSLYILGSLFLLPTGSKSQESGHEGYRSPRISVLKNELGNRAALEVQIGFPLI